MYGATLLSRITWNWAWYLPVFQEKWSKIDSADMTILPHWTRCDFVSIQWNNLAEKTSLASAFLRMYWKQALLQWSLGLLHGISSYAIYWTNQKLLEALERSSSTEPASLQAWSLVVCMSLAVVISEVSLVSSPFGFTASCERLRVAKPDQSGTLTQRLVCSGWSNIFIGSAGVSSTTKSERNCQPSCLKNLCVAKTSTVRNQSHLKLWGLPRRRSHQRMTAPLCLSQISSRVAKPFSIFGVQMEKRLQTLWAAKRCG